MTIPAYPNLAGLTFPVTRTLIFSTLQQTSWSGKAAPVQIWSYPRRQYDLVYEFLRSAAAGNFSEQETLEAFHATVAGSSGVFSFTDVDDQSVTNANFGTGDGVTQTFQLLRQRGYALVEPVYAPHPGFAVMIGGQVAQGYSIGTNAGQIVFPSPPSAGAALTWTGSFDWLCRMNDDTLEFQKFMNGLWSVGKVSFTTVKL